MKDFSYITASHPSYVENLYLDFKKDPNSVDQEFRKFFEGYDFAATNGGEVASKEESEPLSSATIGDITKDFGVYRLIKAYRRKAHLIAKTNPIRERKDRKAHLALEDFGLSESDLQLEFQAAKIAGLPVSKLQDIIAFLTKCYANHVGIEFESVNDPEKVRFIIEAAEKTFLEPVETEQQKRILEKLNQGVMFEKFLQTKYIGQKRFSIEGGESAIAGLDAIITKAADTGVVEFAIGMAHRGRLNVLANILGKTYEHIFREFEGIDKLDSTMGSGDVKYHVGYSSEVVTPHEKKIHLKMAPNPSHLEAVGSVIEGFARSKADAIYHSEYEKILPIMFHGDSALAGEGPVYEVLQMGGLKGYYTGGTIHFVINNQVGFTTDFDDARTSDYCTSLAATVQAPVFHVNGDDAEAVVKACEIATMYRQKFHSDIFIDMVCYRRHGHNEGDDPKFTQPELYALIDNHPDPREMYIKYLKETDGDDKTELANEMEKKFWDDLQARLDEVKQNPLPYHYQEPEKWWRSLRKAEKADFEQSPETFVSEKEIRRLYKAIMAIPAGFTPLNKVNKILKNKEKVYTEEDKFDWATGELLAYASILDEGKDVRMAGQDVIRGTFSHRHAVLRDIKTHAAYNRLSNIAPNQGQLRIFNSPLNEYASMGFEYGYAMANPNNLVLWESQFGDFANNGQAIIDEFISSAEQKWGRMNGMVLLMPHGYEGQGPDHSSARIERFLQMSAEYNWVLTNVTTAANFFHVLRRQLAWPFRKPLVNFSPKANLRLPDSYSKVTEFTKGGFRETIDDEVVSPEDAERVLFCSGKIYFELEKKRLEKGDKKTAILRVEQLYPLPENQIIALHNKYSKAVWYWVQEEPLNMGAASYLRMHFNKFSYGIISRPPSASTSSGFSKIHKEEQERILETAFTV